MSGHSQQGSTLVISMIVLVAVMLLGTMAMITSNTQYKLAGNLQFLDTAMNDAEATLHQAESRMKSGAIDYNHADFFAASSVSASSSGLYPKGANLDPLEMSWNSSDSALLSPGRYMIELVSTNNVLAGGDLTLGGTTSHMCTRVNTYRITSKGVSWRGTERHVQSFYSVITSC